MRASTSATRASLPTIFLTCPLGGGSHRPQTEEALSGSCRHLVRLAPCNPAIGLSNARRYAVRPLRRAKYSLLDIDATRLHPNPGAFLAPTLDARAVPKSPANVSGPARNRV